MAAALPLKASPLWFAKVSLICVICWSAFVAKASSEAQNPPFCKETELGKIASVIGNRVLIKGVCCFHSALANELFLQDATGGALIRPGQETSFELGAGQLLEIEGTVTAGSFALEILAHKIRLLGESPLPSPAEGTDSDLRAGELNCCYVQVTGMVRAVMPARRDGMLPVLIATEAARVMVLVKDHHVEDCRELVGARVRVVGVCLSEPTSLANVSLRVSGMGGIEIVTLPRIPPLLAPGEWLHCAWNVGAAEQDRVRVSGMVWSFDSETSFVLVHGAQAVLIESSIPARLRRGDKVEAIGFPVPRQCAPLALENAIIRKTGADLVPAPVPVRVDQRSPDSHLGKLIQVKAVVSEIGSSHNGIAALQEGLVRFVCRFDGVVDDLPKLKPGDWVQVTGVWLSNRWHANQNQDIGRFALVAGSRMDIELTSRNSYWARAALVSGSALFALVMGLQWRLRKKRMGHKPT